MYYLTISINQAEIYANAMNSINPVQSGNLTVQVPNNIDDVTGYLLNRKNSVNQVQILTWTFSTHKYNHRSILRAANAIKANMSIGQELGVYSQPGPHSFELKVNRCQLKFPMKLVQKLRLKRLRSWSRNLLTES